MHHLVETANEWFYLCTSSGRHVKLSMMSRNTTQLKHFF